MKGILLNPSPPTLNNSINRIKWYKIRVDGPKGGELLPHWKSLFGFLKSFLHLSEGFTKSIQRLNKYSLTDAFKDHQYVIPYEMVQSVGLFQSMF